MSVKTCLNREVNIKRCACTYGSCSRKGICCECIRYHLSNDEMPACFFPDDIERTYDRSVERFMAARKRDRE